MPTIKRITGLMLLTMISIISKAQVGCEAGYTYTIDPNNTLSVEFTDTSLANIPTDSVDVVFHYTEGNITIPLNSSFTHEFNSPGVYACVQFLTAYLGGIIVCQDTSYQYITVGDSTPDPCSGFTLEVVHNPGSMQLEATVQGGVSPYTYEWTNGSTTQTISTNGLALGYYCVSAMDADGCMTSNCYNFLGEGCEANYNYSSNPNNNLEVTFEDASVISLPSDSVSVLFGFLDVSSYEYTTLNGSLTHIYNSAGVYDVLHQIVVYSGDSIVCVDSTWTSITAIDSSSNLCSNFSTSINNSQAFNILQAVPTGGTVPYSYEWNNGNLSGTTTANSIGQYCVTVTDANGCTASDCFNFIGNGNCNWYVYAKANPWGWLDARYNGNAAAPVTFSWSNGANTQLVPLAGLAPGTYCVTATDANQCTASICIQYDPSTFCYDTLCGIAFHDENTNGLLDNSESGIPNLLVTGNNYWTTYTDANGEYSFIVPCDSFVSIQIQTNNSFPLISSPVQATPYGTHNHYTILSANTSCGFNFGLIDNVISVSGTVYADLNNNGIQNSGEYGIAYQNINFGSYSTYTNASGNYSILLPVGSYSASCTASSIYAGLSATPSSISINGTSSGQSFNNINFGLNIQAGSVNLVAMITPNCTVSPGFPTSYSINICNAGAISSIGNTNMFFDSALEFDYANPAPTSYNNSTHTASWTTPSILPGSCYHISVHFNTPSTVPLGTNTIELINVIPTSGIDILMSNNVDTVHQTVVGSWDPNNKLSVETNHNNAAFQYASSINSNQEIEYVINFQNTGTAPAVNVVVKDILSNDLDENTFEMMSTSHPCVVTRTGKNLNFKFSNIMLADSFHNEPESHGFIAFKVKSVPGLSLGHIISDDADIYFDFNDPVNTGFSTVTIVDVDGIEEGKETATVIIAPHPVRDYAIIRLSNSSYEGFELHVTDMMGRMVSNIQTETNEIRFSRNQLASGMYSYKIVQNGKKVGNGKLVVE